MCNIVCNGHNDNPVCGGDGVTYDTPCHVREASCLKQLKIDIKHVGRCQGNEEIHKSIYTLLINKHTHTLSDDLNDADIMSANVTSAIRRRRREKRKTR